MFNLILNTYLWTSLGITNHLCICYHWWLGRSCLNSGLPTRVLNPTPPHLLTYRHYSASLSLLHISWFFFHKSSGYFPSVCKYNLFMFHLINNTDKTFPWPFLLSRYDLLPHCKILKRFVSSSSSSILSLTHSNEGLFSTIQLKLVLTTSAMTFKLQNIISNYMSSTFLTQRAAVAYFLILCMLFFVIF